MEVQRSPKFQWLPWYTYQKDTMDIFAGPGTHTPLYYNWAGWLWWQFRWYN